MDDLWEKAERLASRLYPITIERDHLSDGSVVYLARNPELPGCKAQGTSIQEATTNLEKAQVDYIHALLESGLPVPEPSLRVDFIPQPQ
jgi:predicted RNase H-like HicB family nuclease